jgi:hypothetical protein
MIDRQTKQFMSKNLTKTQKHTHTLLLIGRGVYQLVGVPPSSPLWLLSSPPWLPLLPSEPPPSLAGNLLDHVEVLEFISQPMDPEGETLHVWVLVHIVTN